MLFNKDSRKWTKKALRPDISYTPIKFSVLWHGRIEILHRKNKALHTHTPVLYIHLFMNGFTKTWHFDSFRKCCIPLCCGLNIISPQVQVEIQRPKVMVLENEASLQSHEITVRRDLLNISKLEIVSLTFYSC